MAGEVKPLECTLTDLSPAIEYTVEAKACRAPTDSDVADACSLVKQVKGMTIPSGEWIFILESLLCNNSLCSDATHGMFGEVEAR